jgi:hypothetical protein
MTQNDCRRLKQDHNRGGQEVRPSQSRRCAHEGDDLVIGYNEANTSPLLKFILSKVDDLKFRVAADKS